MKRVLWSAVATRHRVSLRGSHRGGWTLPHSMAIVLLALTLPLSAAVIPSALTGHVLSNGKPVADATVTLTAATLPQPRTATTTATGAYWVEDLPPGVYDVTFSRAGMQTLTRRAVLELARVSRADAALEPSEEEESVTSTATTISVADTQPLTAHVTDTQMDALPIRRTPGEAAAVVAGPSSAATGTLVDGASSGIPFLLGQEALEEVTVIRAGAPVDSEGDGLIVAKTRSGGETFAFSLRDTFSGGDHFLEAASGGPLSHERLWFFGSVWRGGEDDRALHEVRGFTAKLTAQPGVAHSLIASYLEGAAGRQAGTPHAGSQGTLQYTGVPNPNTTIEAVAARSTTSFTPSVSPLGPTALSVDDSLHLKGTRLLSHSGHDSLLTAGGRFVQSSIGGSAALFVNDRWSSSRLLVHAGARLERGGHELHLRPRLGLTWDVEGDGRRALFATFSDSADPRLPAEQLREVSAGYAAAIGTSGTFRADLAHRQFDRPHEAGSRADVLHVEGAYRLFDRFDAGGFYEYVHGDHAVPDGARHAAHGWLSAEFPLAGHVLSAALLERFTAEDGAHASTDIALRYTIPMAAFSLTAAADLTNVFQDEDFPEGREVRAWLRVRR